MKLTPLALCLLLLLAFFAQAQTTDTTSPNILFFVGASGDPNGSLSSVTGDIGGAKLVGKSDYLGGVAHLGRGDSPDRLKTKVQLHYAKFVTKFRTNSVHWTMEVGPDFLSGQPLPAVPPSTEPGNTGTKIGYAVGSGPAISIPVGKQSWLVFHVEATKGSLENLGWRGGALWTFGSN